MSIYYGEGISSGYFQQPASGTIRSISTDGTADIVRIPGNAAVHALSTNMSAFAWVKTTDTENNTGIFAKNDYFALRCWGMETLSNGRYFIGMVSADGTVASKTYQSRTVINDGVWHHCGFTFNNGVLKIYVDGVEDTSPVKVTDTAISTIHLEPTTNLTIGGLLYNGVPDLLLNGKVNQPRLFNITLSGAQVTELYNGGLNCELSLLSFAANCLASYRFDSRDTLAVVRDETGNGNNGAYSGQLSDFSSDVPVLRYGLTLATNKRIVVPHSSSLALSTQMTVFFLFKYSNVGTEQALIGKTDYSAGKRSWWIEKDFRGGGQLLFFCSDTGGAGRKTYGTSAVQENKGWQSYCVTFNANTIKIYINGVEDTSPEKIADNTVNSLYQASDVSLSIGCIFSNTTPSLFYNGNIDEPRVYNTALSSSQVLALHNAVLSYQTGLALDSASSMVLGFRFNPDFDTPPSFVDISGNANHGTSTNISLSDFTPGVF